MINLVLLLQASLNILLLYLLGLVVLDRNRWWNRANNASVVLQEQNMLLMEARDCLRKAEELERKSSPVS